MSFRIRLSGVLPSYISSYNILSSKLNVKVNFFIIERDEFYILRSKESIIVKNNQAAELEPFKDSFGNFRVHYAGFFDPGFGNSKSGILTIMISPIWSKAEINSSDSFVVSNEPNVFFNIRDILVVKI